MKPRALLIRLQTVPLLLLALRLDAALQLASPFGDHMVLQRERAVPVWGTANPGDRVVVAFAASEKSTVAGLDGRWRVDLDPLPASRAPRTLVVSSARGSEPGETLRFNDVLVGEVWLCGGQSNMERQLGPRPPQKPIVDWEAEAAAARHPQIRQLYVNQRSALSPQAEADMRWAVCSPENVLDFTAVGYFFARDLHLKLGVPVGIIHSSWGGTPAEAWTSAEGLMNFDDFRASLADLKAARTDPAGARAAHLARLEEWFRGYDPGSGPASWAAPALDTNGWESIEQPAMWETASRPGFDGVGWLRRSFDLPASWQGGDVELHLGAIDDSDNTWVNGIEVGCTDTWDTPRVYRIPASALKREGNVIAIRVLDAGGGGGIWNASLPLEVRSLDGSFDAIPLRGPWLIRYSLDLHRSSQPPRSILQGIHVPTVLYNGMIEPLVPYALRGFAFYQGEANASRSRQYRDLLPALIVDWRGHWSDPSLPFLFVQIAPVGWMPPEIREAQLLAWRRTPGTAMAVTIDCGDANDIHPANKAPVGARLAIAARALAYGESIEYSGPVFAGLSTEGARATLRFDHLGGGLVAKDGPLTGFTVAGDDGVFHPAEARIVGDTVEVTSPVVARPARVRYGWAHVASGNLFNRAGLPASPFRSDVE
jgi:sialate O-acetylesterase